MVFKAFAYMQDQIAGHLNVLQVRFQLRYTP